MYCSRALLFAATLLVTPPLFADTPPGTIGYNQWGLCPPLPPSPAPAHNPAPQAGTASPPTRVSADELDGYTHGLSLLSGNAQAQQGGQWLRADRMRYDAASGDTHAVGDVRYSSSNIALRGRQADYNFNNASGVFEYAEFWLPERHGRGTAKLLRALDKNHSLLSDVRYTTCPVGHRDWMLNARDLELDQSTSTGVGHDVTIDFFGVPIFWTPYINFPLNDDRKSGFLAPSFGYSTFTGTDLSTPYYLNLAPNYDATLAPRIITKRGVDLGGELRYLSAASRGQIDLSYLPHDKLAGRERGWLSFNNNTAFVSGWNFNTAYNWVSDNLYFQDLGDSLATIATTTQERHLQLSYGQRDWSFLTQVQEWQVVDPSILPSQYPYKRLPQALFTWQSAASAGGPQYGLNAEAVQFQQDARIGALRTDLKPSASYTFGDSGFYFTPTTALRITAYDLNQNLPSGMNARLSRVTPIVSLDSGLFLDRAVGDGSYEQTLEPRLFYLYVPNRDQSQIPIFDTVQPDFSFLQLFSDNRFYGADRQGDANQLSYALTSRLLDTASGTELLEADIGQIRYFRDRYVQLPGVAPQTNLFSDIVAELTLNFDDDWSTSYGQQWNPATRQTDLGSVGVQYHPGYRQVVNLAYRYNRNLALRQTDLSFAWPLTSHWSMVGRWNYDIQNHVTLENFAGFEYDSCCWTFQVVHRRFITQTGQANTAIFFQLQLKGLATLGRHLDDFLQNGILGYSDPSQPY
ncbi:MAG: LPS assembly protein LptD [Gammaproteobacteria bacterium]|nr:LPS assembly protein LptD [Gammaproteobacteria bacterium]